MPAHAVSRFEKSGEVIENGLAAPSYDGLSLQVQGRGLRQ